MSHGKRLRQLFWPHRRKFTLAFVMIIIHSMVPAALVLLIQRILDDALINRDAAMIKTLPFALAGLYAVNGFLSFSRGMLTRGIAWQVVTELRAKLFSGMMKMGIGWRQKRSLGELLSRLNKDASQVQYVVSAVISAIQQPLTLLTLLIAAFHMHPMLTLVGTAVLPLVVWPIRKYGRRLREASSQELEQTAVFQSSAAETLNGFAMVKASGSEAYRVERFQQENETLRRLKMEAIAARLMSGPAIEFIAALGVGAAIAWGGDLVLEGALKPGQLIAFLVAMGLLNGPLKGIAEVHSLWQRSISGADSVFSILDDPETEGDDGARTLDDEKITVEVENLCFSHTSEPVIENLNFRIKPGEVLALVGASGTGKSTVASLLLRFHKPDSGNIRFNGVDIHEYTLDSHRNKIAVVFQRGFLFNTTIRENLCLGNHHEEKKIRAALEAARILEFIDTLEKGLETVVEEGGARLSGGELQRICIARALLEDSPFLILDEPSSQLDAKAEREVREALKNLMQGRTVLLITHSPGMLAMADQVVELV